MAVLLNTTKICSKCRRAKPISVFNRDRKQKDGMYACCKACKRQVDQRRAARHKQNPSEVPEEKLCPTCCKTKPSGDFGSAPGRPDGLKGVCTECERKSMHAYRQTDRGRLAMRKVNLKRSYGISLEQYEEMLERQNGVCAVCERKCSVHPNLSVDHDHVTGKVRGLLCNKCNTALGKLRHDPKILRRAIAYLGLYRRPEPEGEHLCR